MSEDRLEKALEAVRNESVPDDALARAHARVLETLTAPGEALCADFRLQWDSYLESRLDENRRLLMEDHLSRCAHCRALLSEHRGGPAEISMPGHRASRWPRWGSWLAAAAVLCAAVYLGRTSIDTALARGPRATVASVAGTLYLIPEGVLKTGATLGEKQAVRTGPGSHAVLRLADGSLVEVNERTEVSVHAAWSGKVLQLRRGDIIVQAAKQRRGYLRVQTRDAVASVKGTVFAVSAGLSGSRVSVIEGAVAVAQAGSEVVLEPGEQTASNPALIGSIRDAVSWSSDADTYFSMLASLAQIEKQLARMPPEPMRRESRLLPHLPPHTILYGAMPNLSGTIEQAMGLVAQQSSTNPAFGYWWKSPGGQSLQQLVDRVQAITHLLGNEIVFGVAQNAAGSAEKIPMILAEIRPGKQADLEDALAGLSALQAKAPLPYHLTGSLMIVSDSRTHLNWLAANLGQGQETPFIHQILAHYQRGTGWLLGMDMDALVERSAAARNPFIGAHPLKHLFLEQRTPQGVEENALTLTFKGPRMGLASLLANSGSGGAAEYIPGDVIAAAYASTREPRQLFDELTALLAKAEPSFAGNLSKAESTLGISFANDFAAALGTESAFGIEGISTSGPVWMMAALVNNPSTLDGAIHRLVQGLNAQLAAAGHPEKVFWSQQKIDGRRWDAIKFLKSPISITWTYDHGFMVASSDRGAALRAIAARNGGSALIWTPAFQQQLPGAAGLHPSGFAWLNTKGALADFAGLTQNPSLRQALAERDPILAVFNATTEQIQAISRTRISGFIMDLMLLQSAGHAARGERTH